MVCLLTRFDIIFCSEPTLSYTDQITGLKCTCTSFVYLLLPPHSQLVDVSLCCRSKVSKGELWPAGWKHIPEFKVLEANERRSEYSQSDRALNLKHSKSVQFLLPLTKTMWNTLKHMRGWADHRVSLEFKTEIWTTQIFYRGINRIRTHHPAQQTNGEAGVGANITSLAAWYNK